MCCAYLHGGLECLRLDGVRLPHPELLHVCDLAGVPVDAYRSLPLRVLRPQLHQETKPRVTLSNLAGVPVDAYRSLPLRVLRPQLHQETKPRVTLSNRLEEKTDILY